MSTVSSATSGAAGAWTNQQLAGVLGYAFADTRPAAVRNLSQNAGRNALLGALRLKDSAQILVNVNTPKPASNYSMSWMPQGMMADMVEAATSLYLANHDPAKSAPASPGIRPDKEPMPGEHVDVQG